MKALESNEIVEDGRILPPAGRHMIVHCPGFSCLGYLDRDGTWKNAFTDEELPCVIDYSPIGG